MAPLGDPPASPGPPRPPVNTSTPRRRPRKHSDTTRRRHTMSGASSMTPPPWKTPTDGDMALVKTFKPGELAVSEAEIPPGMGEMEIGLLRSKKYIEKQLAYRLEKDIEKEDELIGALSKFSKNVMLRDKVVSTAKGVDNAIKTTVFKDPEHRSRMYRVEVQMGKFTSGLCYRKEGRGVTVEGCTPDKKKLLKEVKVEFPDTVNMAKLVVVCKGSKVEMRVPIRHWESMPCLLQASSLDPTPDPSDTEGSNNGSHTMPRKRASSCRRSRSRSRARSHPGRKDSETESDEPTPLDPLQLMRTAASPDDSGFMSSDTESLPDNSGLTEHSLVDEWFRRNRLWNRFTWNI